MLLPASQPAQTPSLTLSSICRLNYDDHVSDGFYDVLGEFNEVAPKKTFPSLDALRRVTLNQDDVREVMI